MLSPIEQSGLSDSTYHGGSEAITVGRLHCP